MRTISLFLISVLLAGLLAGCREPGPGSVAGQVIRQTADGGVENVAGAQIVLRRGQDVRTTVSDQGESADGQADGSPNYRFENVPPGTYTMSVTAPPGSGLQPWDDLQLAVESEELFLQNVPLLAEGVAKPRPLAPSELEAGQSGYVNGRGDRVVHSGGPDLTDFLLLYLLMRNPPGFGYGVPPVIVSAPPTTTGGPRYRVEDPPTTTRTGQRVTTRPASVPGQGSTRPGSAPVGGAGPTTRPPSSNGSSPDGSSPAGAKPGAGVPALATPGAGVRPPASGGAAAPRDDSPGQGSTRPGAAPSSRPSAPAPSRPSGGGSRGGRR